MDIILTSYVYVITSFDCIGVRVTNIPSKGGTVGLFWEPYSLICEHTWSPLFLVYRSCPFSLHNYVCQLNWILQLLVNTLHFLVVNNLGTKPSNTGPHELCHMIEYCPEDPMSYIMSKNSFKRSSGHMVILIHIWRDVPCNVLVLPLKDPPDTWLP